MKRLARMGINLSAFVLMLLLGKEACFGQNNDVKRKYRLAISFASECCGIDQKAEDRFKKFIAAQERKNRIKLESIETHWDKEGERNYCFELKGLSKSKQKSLISALRKLLAPHKLVQVKENGYCRSSMF